MSGDSINFVCNVDGFSGCFVYICLRCFNGDIFRFLVIRILGVNFFKKVSF